MAQRKMPGYHLGSIMQLLEDALDFDDCERIGHIGKTCIVAMDLNSKPEGFSVHSRVLGEKNLSGLNRSLRTEMLGRKLLDCKTAFLPWSSSDGHYVDEYGQAMKVFEPFVSES